MRISKGVHLTIYPEKKELWDAITCSKELPSLISVAKAKFIQLYTSCGKGANKYAHFLRSWNEYIVTHTSNNPSPENVIIWQKMITSYSHSVCDDDKRIILCDILHTLQSQLTMYIAKDVENIDKEDESEKSETSPSDGTALYRIGGWAILSARRFQEKYIKHNKGNHEEVKEDIHC